MTSLAPARTGLSVPADRLQAYDPVGLGVHQSEFRALVSTFQGSPQSKIIGALEGRLTTLSAESKDDAAFATALLVLRDYIHSGYYPIVAGGRCFLAAIWDSDSMTPARRAKILRKIYGQLRTRSLIDLNQVEWVRQTSSTLLNNSGYRPDAVLRLIQEGDLKPTLTTVQSGDGRRLWRATRMTWSMLPDGSAPGRELSFLVADDRYEDTPLGIFQFRNVVPEISSRDHWLGINTSVISDPSPRESGFASAIRRSGDPREAIAATLRILRSLLGNIQSDGLEQAHLLHDLDLLHELNQRYRAAYTDARRLDTGDAKTYLTKAKRAETALDLCRGISGLEDLLAAEDPLEALLDADLAARCQVGTRKIWHYHMGFAAIEMSVCGAAPPFGALRLGKLMASLAGSREALEAWGFDRPLGEIAQSVYLPSVRDAVPNPGPLAIFTSGLYPGHSAQYTRVRSGANAWKKYGETQGYGGSHISGRTLESMRRYNEEVDGYKHITRSFGEGSGARFREVGRALDRLNLPDLRHHNTRRPLYVLPLVDDVAATLFGWGPNMKPVDRPTAQQLATSWLARWVSDRRDDLTARAAAAPDLPQTLAALSGDAEDTP